MTAASSNSSVFVQETVANNSRTVIIAIIAEIAEISCQSEYYTILLIIL